MPSYRLPSAFRLFLGFFFIVGVSSATFVACSTPPKDIPCAADHNCPQGQRCVSTRCAAPTASDASTTDTPAEAAPEVAAETQEATPEVSAETVAEATPEATPINYPPGPYGADVNDTSILISLPTCADSAKTVSFTDYYKQAGIKVILVSVHTVWCPSCKQQAQGLEKFYQSYKNQGLMVWNIMTENATPGSGFIDPATCLRHGSSFGYTFPLLIDSGSVLLRKFFDRNAVPLNMIIRTSDMKIVYKQAGALPERLEGIVLSYLQ